MRVLTIRSARSLPAEIRVLAEAAEAEKFLAIERLVANWDSGTNRFNRDGEVFFTARTHGKLIGCCGLNIDPYVTDPRIGRVRHLYVLPEHRRSGVATQLLRHIVATAYGVFDTLRLRSHLAEAGHFYRSIGFVESSSDTHTHLLNLRSSEFEPI